MNNLKRTLVTAVFAVGVSFIGTTAVVAAGSPTIQAITHAGFGGGTDVTTRMMLLRARKTLGQDMQLVNKKGGGGAASMEYMMTLPADGQHTLTWTTGHAVSMALGKTDVKLSDMRPLARGTDDPQLFVVNCNADIKDANVFINTQKTGSALCSLKRISLASRTCSVVKAEQFLIDGSL